MKKQVRKMTNRTAGYIFFYNLIMVAVMFGAVAIRTIAIMAGAGAEQAAGRAVGAFGQNMGSFLGILSIAGVCGGLLFLAIASRRTGLVREAFRSSRKMEAGNFIRIFCVFMACQTIFTVAALLAELVLNPFGLTLKNAAESASAVSGDLPMFLYASLIGPVAEELVFRGFVLRRLLGGGKGFAIVLSAVLFGAMHGNFLQGTFAVGAGLVFGYVAVEYSIGWSILIHVLNNLVFSDLLGRLAGALPKTAGAVLEYGVPGFFFLAACVILVKEREKIVSWWRRNRPPRRYWLWAFTTFWMLLFLIMETVVALEGVSRL